MLLSPFVLYNLCSNVYEFSENIALCHVKHCPLDLLEIYKILIISYQYWYLHSVLLKCQNKGYECSEIGFLLLRLHFAPLPLFPVFLNNCAGHKRASCRNYIISAQRAGIV